MYNIRKTYDPVLRKFSDRRTDGYSDGRSNGQTNESNFIKYCSTNVEPTTSKNWTSSQLKEYSCLRKTLIAWSQKVTQE